MLSVTLVCFLRFQLSSTTNKFATIQFISRSWESLFESQGVESLKKGFNNFMLSLGNGCLLLNQTVKFAKCKGMKVSPGFEDVHLYACRTKCSFANTNMRCFHSYSFVFEQLWSC